jgi:hypothetical protein
VKYFSRYLFFFALLAPLQPALAQDYEAGKRAYLAGDYQEALGIWQPLAEGGNEFAQFSMGSLYFEGAGVEKNDAESVKWFRMAGEQGYAPAQFNLGNAYKHGNGVEQDDAQAAEWWRKAAEQEFAPAQFNLGTQYYFGRGVPKDEEAAISWYRRAAQNGHAQAQRLFSMTDTPASQVPATAAAPSSGGGEAVAAAAATGAATTVAATPPPAEPAATSTTTTPATGTAREDWLLAQKPGDFTLQLLATQSEDLMLKYLGKHQFDQTVAYFAFQRDGKQWYAAVYGAYPGKSQAEAAVSTLPASAKQKPPWIRQFGGIQKLIVPR